VSSPEPADPVAKEWEELRRLAEKLRSVDDPDISKALEAVVVGKAQSLALVAKRKPAWLAGFPLLAGMLVSIPSEEEIAAPPPEQTPEEPAGPVPNDVEKAERLIREAHLFSMRGDKSKAKDLLDEAEKAAPRSAPVLAALGEAALERHNVKEAVRLYALAKAAEPGNVAYERRHAEAVFRQSQGTIFDPTARSGAGFEAVASAKAAVILSVMLPGLGQIVSGEIGKGVFLMAVWLGSWIAVMMIGFKGLFAAIGMGSSADANLAAMLPLALAVMFHLWAILDASTKAKSFDRRKVDRPVPPSHLPFE
jgi:tetratricopeptide (TPR) repeat protein